MNLYNKKESFEKPQFNGWNCFGLNVYIFLIGCIENILFCSILIANDYV
jgi:hypothetical protein